MTDNIRFHRVEPNREEPDDSDVPPELQPLLPYALRLRSEWDPDRAMNALSPAEREDLKRLMAVHRPALEEWLEESEDKGSPYPAAHVPFSTLRMIADMLSM